VLVLRKDSYQWIRLAFDCINKRSSLLFLSPTHKSFGNGAEEIFFGILQAKREGKKIVFLYPRPLLFRKLGVSVANCELFGVESDHSIPNTGLRWALAGCLLTIVYVGVREAHPIIMKACNLLRGMGLLNSKRDAQKKLGDLGPGPPGIGKGALWKPDGLNSFSWKSVEQQNWKRQYEEFIPPRLNQEKHRYAEQIRVRMGIPLSDWFVCLHVPEAQTCHIRHSTINNYLEAIRIVTVAGGWIVRLGSATMTPLSDMERVIDYAHTPHKSELMDIYLISQCRFFLGSNSGPPAVAFLFRRPYILVNITEWSLALPLNRGDLALTKHVFSRSRNRFLSVKEMLEEPFSIQVFGSTSANEYIMVENTPEEIREVVNEFLNTPASYEYSDLQIMFNDGRANQIAKGLDQGDPQWPDISPNEHLFQQYRLASRMDSAGTLGQRYLEQNWLVDQLQESPLASHRERWA